MSKRLVAYFSASGVTGSVAKKLADATGADIYEIKPAVSYTSADLNWNNSNSRSSIEMRDKTSRPELMDKNAKIGSYDVIFLGFPIWWYVAPTIINTFLEAYNFSGKTIILFATSGGSSFGNTLSGLKASAPGAVIREGKLFNRRVSVEELKKWADGLRI